MCAEQFSGGQTGHPPGEAEAPHSSDLDSVPMVEPQGQKPRETLQHVHQERRT